MRGSSLDPCSEGGRSRAQPPSHHCDHGVRERPWGGQKPSLVSPGAQDPTRLPACEPAYGLPRAGRLAHATLQQSCSFRHGQSGTYSPVPTCIRPSSLIASCHLECGGAAARGALRLRPRLRDRLRRSWPSPPPPSSPNPLQRSVRGTCWASAARHPVNGSGSSIAGHQLSSAGSPAVSSWLPAKHPATCCTPEAPKPQLASEVVFIACLPASHARPVRTHACTHACTLARCSTHARSPARTWRPCCAAWCSPAPWPQT